MPATSPPLLKQKLALGAGFFAMLFASQSVQLLAVPYYQMRLGVDPFLLSVALAVPVLLGLIVTPLIGYASDHCQSNWGRRRPFIVAGSVASGVLFGMIWMVPVDWSPVIQVSFFALVYTLFYLASSCVAVPTVSLSYEISDSPRERQSTMVVTTYFIKLASMLYQWLYPLAGLTLFGSVMVGMQWVGWMTGLVIIGALGMVPAWYVKERSDFATTVLSPQRQAGFMRSLQLLLMHRPLFLLMAICATQLGLSVYAASMDYYLLVYWVSDGNIEQGAVLKGALSTAYAAVGLLSVPLMSALSRRYNKLLALEVVLWMTLAGSLVKWFVFVPGAGLWVITDAVLCAGVWTAMTTVIPECNADLSLQHRQVTHKPVAGMYAAILNCTGAFATVMALVCSGATLNLIGFNALADTAQSHTTLTLMRVILCAGTALAGLLALWLLGQYKTALQHDYTRTLLAADK